MEITKTPVANPADIHCEIYNPSDEKIFFTRMEGHAVRRKSIGLTPGDEKIECAPKGYCYLPHQYYIAEKVSGAPVEVIINYGDAMGKANRNSATVSK